MPIGRICFEYREPKSGSSLANPYHARRRIYPRKSTTGSLALLEAHRVQKKSLRTFVLERASAVML